LTMACAQVLGNDVAVGFGGASGNFELNVYRPLIINAFLQSCRLIAEGARSFGEHCAEGIEPNLPRIKENLERSLMLVTALSPVIGYDKASKIAHYAMDNDLTLKDAAMKLGFVSSDDFDRTVDPKKMVAPSVA